LLSRATTNENTTQNMQVTDTAVIGARLINEARFQYRRSRSKQTGDAATPTISVLDAFTGGGASLNVNYYHSDNFEFQNYTSYTRARHFVKFGARIRGTIENGFSTSNYNGTYTFNSINAYAITERGLAQGLTMGQIQAQGGGPSQYSVTGGIPLANVVQVDVEPFVQDDWRIAPNFTLSTGLRYETQTNIRDNSAWAPRIGLAWGLGKSGRRANAPKTVLRAGFGVFYDRFSEGQTLIVHRQNGIVQQQFLVPFPNFFPVAPPVSQLLANQIPQAIREVDSRLEAPRIVQTAFGVERQLPKNISLSVNYTDSRGVHQLRTRNINSPVPGTGVFPYGAARGQLYLLESSALFKQTQLKVDLNARVNSRVSMFANYMYGQAHSNSDGINTFPANAYDTSTEWGRASFDIRQRFQFGGTLVGPFKLQFNPQINATTEPPVNITLGRDLNGDSIFNDRPAFATDLSRPSVRITRWGIFDSDPIPGQTIIPRNYGAAYGNVSVNLRASRAWGFGERANAGGRGGASNRYNLTASIQARNLINTVNPGAPNGNLSSTFFGQATNIQGNQNANRRLEMQLRFAF
jgi:hypothetical protein